MHLPRRPVWSDDQFTALASTPGPAHPLRTGPRPIGSHAGALVESHCGPRRASLTTNGPDRYDVSTRSALAEVAVAIHCTTARATLTADRASAGGARGRRRRWPLARGGSTKSHSKTEASLRPWWAVRGSSAADVGYDRYDGSVERRPAGRHPPASVARQGRRAGSVSAYASGSGPGMDAGAGADLLLTDAMEVSSRSATS